MVQTARKTLLSELPYNETAVLLLIKTAFAFSWGFLDVIAYLLTRRFSTMMSGNTLVLAIETSDWESERLMLTATLIILYVCGGAAYDALAIGLGDDDHGRAVQYFALPSVVVLGVLGDAMQYAMHSCLDGKNGADCSGKYLYFLAPVALSTGIVTSYLSAHPDGIVTNMVTGHMKALPKAILKRVLKGTSSDLEKGLTSAAIITSFFLGCLVGAFSSPPILSSYSKGRFTPVYTVFACVVATLCFLHFNLCERFCYNYALEKELIERMRETLAHREVSAHNTTVSDVQRIMIAELREEEDRPLSPCYLRVEHDSVRQS